MFGEREGEGRRFNNRGYMIEGMRVEGVECFKDHHVDYVFGKRCEGQ